MTITQIAKHNKQAGYFFFDEGWMKRLHQRLDCFKVMEIENRIFIFTTIGRITQGLAFVKGPAADQRYIPAPTYPGTYVTTLAEYDPATGDVFRPHDDAELAALHFQAA